MFRILTHDRMFWLCPCAFPWKLNVEVLWILLKWKISKMAQKASHDPLSGSMVTWSVPNAGLCLLFSKDMYGNVNATANIICRYTLWGSAQRTFYTSLALRRKKRIRKSFKNCTLICLPYHRRKPGTLEQWRDWTQLECAWNPRLPREHTLLEHPKDLSLDMTVD